MFKLWSDYHVYVSTITKKYLLGKSVVIYRSFELLVCRDELLDGLVLHTWIRAADAKVDLMVFAAYITFCFNL
jgi:accessory colonization factor AcfC